MRLHLLIAYLKFWLKSTNEHGVHSPFVYQLVTRCFYDQADHLAYVKLGEQNRIWYKRIHQLSFSGTEQMGEPFGECKASGMKLRQAKLLNRLVRYLNVERILEFGSSLGLKPAAMATSNKVNVVSVDACAMTTDLARQNLLDWNLTNVEVRGGSLATGIDYISSKKVGESFDLIYIDLAQQQERVLESFRMLLSFTHNDTLIIFEGIHDSLSAEMIWEEIVGQSEVRVSIDTFKWGLVFFRREQVKEHFVIRV